MTILEERIKQLSEKINSTINTIEQKYPQYIQMSEWNKIPHPLKLYVEAIAMATLIEELQK